MFITTSIVMNSGLIKPQEADDMALSNKYVTSAGEVSEAMELVVYRSANQLSSWPPLTDATEMKRRRVRMSRLYIGVLALVIMCCQIVPSTAMRMMFVTNARQNPYTYLEMSTRGGMMGNQNENNNNNNNNNGQSKVNNMNRKSRSTLGAKSSGSTSNKGISDHGALSAASSDDGSGSIEEFEPLYSQSYDPLAPPTQYTSERDLEDMLLDRSTRFMDKDKLLKNDNEKCYLVGLEDKSLNERNDDTKFTMEESLTELSELSGAAGLHVIGSTYQRVDRPNIEYYIGQGKVKEIARMMMKNKCCCVVFDTELTPSQQKNLEISFSQEQSFKGTGKVQVKVLDRTALILDIFAQHARTKEGQMQVQLALMTYRLPRLTNMWTHLERQSAGSRGKSNGGVGLRGPGEMQLESDKREMRGKISKLRESINNVRRTRATHRKRRRRLGVPVIALVGYTNAGKSSLLNYLSTSGVFAADMLFATLDPTTRIVRIPGVKIPEVLLTDTVGFVQKLPTNLVAAFRATLEEIAEADILIHVTDITNEARRKQEAAVLRELGQMGLIDTPVVTVWNKIDMVPKLSEYFKNEAKKRDQTVAFSSKTGEGMDALVQALQSAIFTTLESVELTLTYTEINILNILYRIGVVDHVDYKDAHAFVKCRVPTYLKEQLENYFAVSDDEKEEFNIDAPFSVHNILDEDEADRDQPDADGVQDEQYWKGVIRGRKGKLQVDQKVPFNTDDLSRGRSKRGLDFSSSARSVTSSADWKNAQGKSRYDSKNERNKKQKYWGEGVDNDDGAVDDEFAYDDSLLLDFDED